MQSVRIFLRLVLALLVVSTSQSMLSLESVQNEPHASNMVMHAMGTHPAMPGPCHKCIKKAPCCGVGAGTPAILPVRSRVIRVITKLDVALFTEPQFKNLTLSPSLPPPKLGDLT
jgi:hypothetical protein